MAKLTTDTVNKLAMDLLKNTEIDCDEDDVYMFHSAFVKGVIAMADVTKQAIDELNRG